MEAFNTTYSINNKGFAFARNLGVNLLNNLPPLKNIISGAASVNPYAPT